MTSDVTEVIVFLITLIVIIFLFALAWGYNIFKNKKRKKRIALLPPVEDRIKIISAKYEVYIFGEPKCVATTTIKANTCVEHDNIIVSTAENQFQIAEGKFTGVLLKEKRINSPDNILVIEGNISEIKRVEYKVIQEGDEASFDKREYNGWI